MVDFHDKEIDHYLPHNLSNESYHEKTHVDCTVFERLKARNSAADKSANLYGAMDGSQPITQQQPTSTSSLILDTDGNASITTEADVKAPGNGANGNKNKVSVYRSSAVEAGECMLSPVCSPEDICFFLPKQNSTACDDDADSLVYSPAYSDMTTNGNNSANDLESYLKDLSLCNNGHGGGSDSETVFSEDYTAMTDNGEGSEVGDPNNGSIDGDEIRRYSGSSYADSLNGSESSTTVVAEDNDSAEKVTNGQLPPGTPMPQGKHRPDIKLLLSHPTLDVDTDWTDTPQLSEENSPESPEAEQVPGVSNDSNDPDNPFYEDREFEFLRTQPVKRSTSLKTYKTPPGTPHRKKAVRFADALGLDLESVRHILNLEEPPKVPASAMKDLTRKDEDDEQMAPIKSVEGIKYLSLNFPQPGASPTFFQRVQCQKVLLENCVADDKSLTVNGTIRVANISFHKKVVVRYSVNNWMTYTDIQASYVQNSNDGPTDRFSFNVSLPSYFTVGTRLQFCIQYVVGGAEFWDSNYGGNYIVECYARQAPMNDSDNAWLHFL